MCVVLNLIIKLQFIVCMNGVVFGSFIQQLKNALFVQLLIVVKTQLIVWMVSIATNLLMWTVFKFLESLLVLTSNFISKLLLLNIKLSPEIELAYAWSRRPQSVTASFIYILRYIYIYISIVFNLQRLA